MWKKNKWDGSERIAVSGRIFDHLEGALYVQGDTPVGELIEINAITILFYSIGHPLLVMLLLVAVWSPCSPNPCEFMCIRIGQTYTCECPDGMVASGKSCVEQGMLNHLQS